MNFVKLYSRVFPAEMCLLFAGEPDYKLVMLYKSNGNSAQNRVAKKVPAICLLTSGTIGYGLIIRGFQPQLLNRFT